MGERVSGPISVWRVNAGSVGDMEELRDDCGNDIRGWRSRSDGVQGQLIADLLTLAGIQPPKKKRSGSSSGRSRCWRMACMPVGGITRCLSAGEALSTIAVGDVARRRRSNDAKVNDVLSSCLMSRYLSRAPCGFTQKQQQPLLKARDTHLLKKYAGKFARDD